MQQDVLCQSTESSQFHSGDVKRTRKCPDVAGKETIVVVMWHRYSYSSKVKARTGVKSSIAHEVGDRGIAPMLREEQ